MTEDGAEKFSTTTTVTKSFTTNNTINDSKTTFHCGPGEKKPKRDNKGFRYEEQVTALVFLRCLKERLRDFELTSENECWKKLEDIVVTCEGVCGLWKYILFVQLKHNENKKTFSHREVHAILLDSYKSFTEFVLEKKLLQYSNYTMAVATNRPLTQDAKKLFEIDMGSENILEREYLLKLLDSVDHIKILKADGKVLEEMESKEEFRKLYSKHRTQEDVEKIKKNIRKDFMEHFFFCCEQKGVNEIKEDIHKELECILHSPGAEQIRNACEELCECLEIWKDEKCENPERLSSSWLAWKEIEGKYKSSAIKRITICLSLLALIFAILLMVFMSDTPK